MLPLVLSPQPILRQVAAEVALPATSDVQVLIKEMFEAMNHYHGIGLAAPQVNISRRLFVIATSPQSTAYINPKIIKSSWKKVDMEEGCLSIPQVFGVVRRPERVYVSYYTLNGEKKIEWLDAMVARVFQHELDHINGVLFTDKALTISSGSELLAKYGLER